MLYSNIAYVLITIFLIYKLLKNDFNLFHVLVFVLPFNSWYYELGLQLTIFQIVTLFMVLTTVLSLGDKKNNLTYFGNRYISIFLLFAVFNTLIMSAFFIDEYLQLGTYLRSDGRFISQILLLLITFSIIPLAFNYIKSTKDIHVCFNVYLYALITLVVLGWIQYFTYSLIGFDLFPLSINQFGDVRTGMDSIVGVSIMRMSSLGGEPKGFSISLVIGFFLIHVFNKYGISFFKYDVILKYLFLFTAFATLSTSGMVLFVILFVTYTLYQFVKKTRGKIKAKNIFISVTILSVIGFMIMKNWEFTSLVVEQRVLGRDIVSEDFDAPIQMFLSENPEYLFFGSGLGNIHNLAYSFISYEHLHYMGDSIFVAKSGYLRTVSELGIAGLVIFIFMIYGTYSRLGVFGKGINRQHQQVVSAMQLLLVLIAVGYFARSYLVNELFVFLAMAGALAYSRILRKRKII